MIYITSLFTGLISYYISSFFNKGVLFFISFFSIIIFNIEFLSLFKKTDGINILILSFIEFLIAAFLFYRFKKNGGLKINISGFLYDLKNALKSDKSLIILSLFWLFLIGVSFLLSCLSPVNEPDAQGYHALRALFFANDNFIHHFETSDVRCHSMPINSELFYTWILALSKKDIGFGLLQFFSYFLLIISSYKVMEHYNIDFNKRLWSILIFSSFAGVISQISSTQTDLCTGSLLVTSLYLILEYKKENKLHLLYFSSLSMTLAFGVKSTGVIASIPLLIWFIFLIKKDFIKFFLFLIFNFLIFSSYNYFLNFINYGNFLGAKSALNEHKLYYYNLETFIAGGFINLIRYSFSIFDFSGVAPFYLLSPLYDNIVHFVFNFLHINPLFNSNGEIPHLNATLSEQLTGLGVLGWLVLLPASISALFDKKMRILPVIFLIQTLILSFSIIYFPTTIRFFITFVSILFPVLALCYKKGFYKNLIAAIAFLYLVFCPLFLVQRPFLNILYEFKLNPDITSLSDNLRDVRYKFYFISKSHILFKDEVDKICNGNKIGIYSSDGFMLYPVKLLDFNKKCKIDFLKFDEQYDLNQYDYLLFQDDIQEYSATNNFVGTDKCKITNYMGRSTGKICLISPADFYEKGFVTDKKVQYFADDFLKKTGNDNDTTFFIMKNTNR